jgi:hypothetical protein
MSKIIVNFQINQILIRHVHALHYISLYGQYIYESVTSQHVENGATDGLDLADVHSRWAGEEVLRVGLITLYHHWEKSISSLIKEQSLRLNVLCRQRNKESIVKWTKSVLRESFEAEIDSTIWESLEEIRRVINTLKHADLETYQNLASDFPSYFRDVSQDLKLVEDFENCFEVGFQNFTRLANTMSSFWENIPHKVDYSRSSLG